MFEFGKFTEIPGQKPQFRWVKQENDKPNILKPSSFQWFLLMIKSLLDTCVSVLAKNIDLYINHAPSIAAIPFPTHIVQKLLEESQEKRKFNERNLPIFVDICSKAELTTLNFSLVNTVGDKTFRSIAKIISLTSLSLKVCSLHILSLFQLK